MTGVAKSAQRAAAHPTVRSLAGHRRWDRPIALSEKETAALLALARQSLRRNKAVGIPRRTARHWRALTRLTEPLDATVAGLHHGDDVRFRRAGRQAAGIVLQHCADTGRSWWGWTPWEWARLCGGSAREFIAAQSLPTEPSVRPFVVALAYLLGGFTDFHRLGKFNRLHLACLIFGEHTVEESLRQASELLDRWGYRDSTGVKHRLRACLARPCYSTAVPGSTTWTRRRSSRCGRIRPPTGTRDRCCMRCSAWSPSWAIAIRRCAPDTTTPPRSKAPIRPGRTGSSAGTPLRH